VGLLNPGGPIAQFKRNRCSISPVEVILLSGVRRSHASKLQNTLGSVHDGDLILRHQFFSTMSSDEFKNKKIARTVKNHSSEIRKVIEIG